ncbi:MAG: virginiamycin B lyase family protein [Thermoanaerobaculia bacterium]
MAASGRGQNITEYPVPTPSSQLRGITKGPDGNVWFTEQLGKKIGRITPQGVITEFAIPEAPGQPTSPNAITLGPDGNVWFADFRSVGRITPSGTITRFFNLPSLSLTGQGITGGPDGNVWFTLSASDHPRIGQIKPNGDIVEFPVLGATGLQDITSGPDGNLWFTDSLGKQIGRMTTAGSVTLFPTPVEVTGPQGIAPGPDGNLWFTSAFHLGRITTAGVFTIFPDPGGDAPRGITAGPDGNMWYVETSGNNIGRITTNGVMTEFRPPTVTSGPFDIAPGSDGALWFTESGGNKIGRIAPASLYTLTPCRVLDTRGAPGPLGGPALEAGKTRNFVLVGRCGIPESVSAVALNVTVTQPTAAGDLRLFPAGAFLPLVSTINYRAGQTRANNAVVGLGGSGDLGVRCDQASGSVHMIVDVNGYFR